MGGLAILTGLAAALFYIWFSVPEGRNLLILFGVGTFGFGAIGLTDDVLSLVREQSKGLSYVEKILSQIAVASVFIFFVFQLTDQPTKLLLPFSSRVVIISPVFYCLLVLFILVGTVNAVNLADGLDGLAASASLISISAYGLIGSEIGLLFISAIFAAIVGLLWYNTYPAELFMGDTGAFALGGFLGAAAIVTNGEIFLPLLGGLFVIESLSVLIQVIYYKTTGRRIFKISPLHHHFESAEGIEYDYLLPKVEWREPKVTTRLLIIHLVIAGIGLIGHFLWIE